MVSLKLWESGQILLSSIPTTTSPSRIDLLTDSEKPIKSHDLVVWSCFFPLRLRGIAENGAGAAEEKRRFWIALSKDEIRRIDD